MHTHAQVLGQLYWCVCLSPPMTGLRVSVNRIRGSLASPSLCLLLPGMAPAWLLRPLPLPWSETLAGRPCFLVDRARRGWTCGHGPTAPQAPNLRSLPQGSASAPLQREPSCRPITATVTDTATVPTLRFRILGVSGWSLHSWPWSPEALPRLPHLGLRYGLGCRSPCVKSGPRPAGGPFCHHVHFELRPPLFLMLASPVCLPPVCPSAAAWSLGLV